MYFMNECEIDQAVIRLAADPVLGPASRTLSNLRDAANANSDGWCYWPKPCRAAKQLQQLVHRGMGFTRNDDVTPAEYRAALSPVKAFRTRSGIDFEIVEL
jgi:hypothetical protein